MCDMETSSSPNHIVCYHLNHVFVQVYGTLPKKIVNKYII